MDASRERIVTLVGLLLAMLLVRWLAAEALDPAPESWVRGENSAPGDKAATGLVFPEPGEPGEELLVSRIAPMVYIVFEIVCSSDELLRDYTQGVSSPTLAEKHFQNTQRKFSAIFGSESLITDLADTLWTSPCALTFSEIKTQLMLCLFWRLPC